MVLHKLLKLGKNLNVGLATLRFVIHVAQTAKQCFNLETNCMYKIEYAYHTYEMKGIIIFFYRNFHFKVYGYTSMFCFHFYKGEHL